MKAELTETRTLLNLHDLTNAFDDELRRPKAAAGPIHGSYEALVRDWTTDSGEPGDKYDPELEVLFREASPGVELDPELMQEFVDKLVEREPELARFLINDPNGIDTMLLQFPVFLDDPGQTRMIQEEIEDIWFGDDGTITATSGSITAVAVTDQITGRQTEAISTTIAVALGILAIFFWLTLRQPALAFIAVGPIVLVLIWVLGTMALLGIPYTLITSIITALSIGIGVDYTIHIIHRYREEFAHLRNPEKAAIRTLSTTGSALLGSRADDGVRIRSAGSIAAARVTTVRHHGDHHYRLLPDSISPGGPARDGGVGRLPEHAAALHGGAYVGRSRRCHRRHTATPRGGTCHAGSRARG